MQTDKTTISQAHQDAHIPSFFLDIWKQKHPNDDPVADEKKYMARRDWAIGIAVATFVCLLATVITWGMSQPDNANSPECRELCLKIGRVLGIVTTALAFSAVLVRESYTDRDWVHQKYYREVDGLFTKLGTKPDAEIAQMSKEVFYATVEETLRTRAAIVDGKRGFDRHTAMEEWKKLHAAALEWGLCKENFIHYFPKSEK